jgi:hypothetical protein
MSDRPTPETDALADSRIGMWQYHLPADFARKMERERDEARELARELRDKLRALADECILPRFNQEWDTFVESESSLTKAKEVLP